MKLETGRRHCDQTVASLPSDFLRRSDFGLLGSTG